MDKYKPFHALSLGCELSVHQPVYIYHHISGFIDMLSIWYFAINAIGGILNWRLEYCTERNPHHQNKQYIQ